MSLPFNPQPKPESRLQKKTRQTRDDEARLRQWKREVWARDEGTCRCCQVKVLRTLKLEAKRGEVHHICGRANRTTRYDTRNGILLCKACHDRVTGAVNDRVFILGTATFRTVPFDGGR